ncbi:pentapeptide repeat-containing protein [Rhodococcus sp. NPDC055024]
MENLARWALGVAVVSLGVSTFVLCSTRGRRRRRVSSGLQMWFWISCLVAATSALSLAVLVGAALHWDWVAGRVGGVLAPLGAMVAAAIASAGAARTLMAQSEIAQKNRVEDAESLLWTRFEKAAQQLASSEHFSIRTAGVYTLVGLADDWLHHHRRLIELGVEGRVEVAECETIVDILCAYLRQNTHLVSPSPAVLNIEAGERVVNEAIIAQFCSHMRQAQAAKPGGTAPVSAVPAGLWAGRGLVLNLYGADLSKSLWSKVDMRLAVLRHANLNDADLSGADLSGSDVQRSDLRNADLGKTDMHGAILRCVDLSAADLRWADLRKADLRGALLNAAKLENVIYDAGTRWPDATFSPPSLSWEIPVGMAHKR